jgi:hypothetical protein
VGDLGASLGTQPVEEAVQGRLVPPGRCPHQAASVVIGHDEQILVDLVVGDVVDPDPAQPGKPVTTASTSALTRVAIAPT